MNIKPQRPSIPSQIGRKNRRDARYQERLGSIKLCKQAGSLERLSMSNAAAKQERWLSRQPACVAT